MSFFPLIVLLSLGSAPFASAVLEDEALWMIGCINTTMSLGLPAAGIPPHLPKVEFRNFTTTFSLGLGDLHAALWNSTWAGIPWYHKPVVTGVSNGDWVFYNYSIYWPSFVIKGYIDWNITTSVFGQLAGQHATFSVNLTGVTWWGTWNMTLPKKSGNSYTLPYLNSFTLLSSTEKTETSLTGLGLINTPVKASLQFSSNYFFNHLPSKIAEGLKDLRFNGHWFDPQNPKPLLAILGNCGLNSTSVE